MVFEHGIEDIGALKRELGKHQQGTFARQTCSLEEEERKKKKKEDTPPADVW